METIDMKRLADLLKADSESSDDDLPTAGMGPGDIKSKVKMKVRGNEGGDENCKKEVKTMIDPKAIWRLDEVEEIPYSDDVLYDPREKPEYDITYRQNVTSQDIYLQLGNKTPMTSSCEMMTITVKLKGETKDSMDVNLSRTDLDIRTQSYRLHLPLPHPVDPEPSQAVWDSKEESLTMSLRLDREYDYVNF